MEKQSQIIIKKLGKFELDNVYCGDCKKEMKYIPSNSIDLIVTDPPYQLDSISKRWGKEGKNTMHFDKSPHHRTIRGFMGKEWDILPPIEVWQENLRVLKPGAFAFIMTTPRQDSLCQILKDLTNAGFYMGFSSIYWTYASGMPKATNIGKMIDKQECKKQLTEKLGRKPTKEEFKKAWEGFRKVEYREPFGREHRKKVPTGGAFESPKKANLLGNGRIPYHKPATPQAETLNGSYGGFQPKPAVEVIIVAMKPLSEKTYIDQALKNKHGITWLDDCKIPYKSETDIKNATRKDSGLLNKKRKGQWTENYMRVFNQKGRFPANLLVSDDVLNVKSRGAIAPVKSGQKGFGGEIYGKYKTSGDNGKTFYSDKETSRSYSRYFDLDNWAVSKGVKDTFPFLIVPKASKSEKNRGLEEFKEKASELNSGGIGRKISVEKRLKKQGKNTPTMKNIHPTVKPIKLMSYLITLGSREGDIILDNFCGSGSTLISAKKLNRRFLGFDTEMEYVEISKARLSAIKHVQEKLL